MWRGKRRAKGEGTVRGTGCAGEPVRDVISVDGITGSSADPERLQPLSSR